MPKEITVTKVTATPGESCPCPHCQSELLTEKQTDDWKKESDEARKLSTETAGCPSCHKNFEITLKQNIKVFERSAEAENYWESHLENDPAFRGSGMNEDAAVQNLLETLKVFGMSFSPDDYFVIKI